MIDMITEISREAEDRGFTAKKIADNKVEITKEDIDPIVLSYIDTEPTTEGQLEVTRSQLKDEHEYAVNNQTLVLLCIKPEDQGVLCASTDNLINTSYDIGVEKSRDSVVKPEDSQNSMDLPNVYKLTVFTPLEELLSIDRGKFVAVRVRPTISYQMFFDVKGTERQIQRGGIMAEVI
jgi:hypothetical protein